MRQEDIIFKALGFYPVPGKKIKSPFRPDRKPTCFFQWKHGWLRFRDFGKGKLAHDWANCYDVAALTFLRRRINEQDVKGDFRLLAEYLGDDLGVKPEQTWDDEIGWELDLSYKMSNWSDEARRWWAEYGILISQLQEDFVFQASSYRYNSKENPRYYITRMVDDLTFVYDCWGGVRKKIYRPEQTERHLKWKTNCIPTDIYFQGDPQTSDTLFVLGSYKDAKVVKNQGFDVRGRQTEGDLPLGLLHKWSAIYPKVVIIGDNDKGGREHIGYIKQNFNTQQNYSNLRNVYFSIPPFTKDPARHFKTHGGDSLTKLLKSWQEFV